MPTPLLQISIGLTRILTKCSSQAEIKARRKELSELGLSLW